METLQQRLRFIMKRDNLTYKQVSSYAEASEQAVYKWLKTGNISEHNARAIAEQCMVDWIWLLYGITRIDPGLLYDLVTLSSSNCMVMDMNEFRLAAVGDECAALAETVPDRLVDRVYPENISDISTEELRRTFQLASVFNGWAELSSKSRLTNLSRGDVIVRKTVQMMTTSDVGHSYALVAVKRDVSDGTENTIDSLSVALKPNTVLDEKAVSYLHKWYGDDKRLQPVGM
ncbi:MAG: helix-turn-helix transcriptional regulator [Candidatus Sedimenticola sp. 20ELBAFRAG]